MSTRQPTAVTVAISRPTVKQPEECNDNNKTTASSQLSAIKRQQATVPGAESESIGSWGKK